MDIKNTEEAIDVIEKPIEPVKNHIEELPSITAIITEVKPEKTKKPRKPLTDEQMVIRKALLQKARDCKKLKALESKKPVIIEQLPAPPSSPVEEPKQPEICKEDKQRIKEEHIKKLVDEKFLEYKQQKILNKNSNTLRKLF